MEAVDPTTTLIVAVFGMLGVTIGPIAVALINRGGKAKPTVPDVDLVGDLDDLNDRLVAEIKRKDRDIARLTDELARERRRRR